MKFIKERGRKRARRAAWMLPLAGLWGCGGSGGEAGPAPSPAPVAPGLSLVDSSPARDAMVAAEGGVLRMRFRVNAALSPSASQLSIRCGAGGASAAGIRFDTTVSADGSSFEVQVRYEDLPADQACKLMFKTSVIAQLGGAGIANDWELPFASGAFRPLSYPATVIGLLGGLPVRIGAEAPFVEPLAVLQDLGPRTAPSRCLLGSQALASGRWPLLCDLVTPSGRSAVEWRLNPALATITPLGAERFPIGHEYTLSQAVSPGVGSFSGAWHQAQLCTPLGPANHPACTDWLGGLPTPPIAGARAWAPDGRNGWYFVRADSTHVLRRRDAAGLETLLYTAADGGVAGADEFSLLMSVSR